MAPFMTVGSAEMRARMEGAIREMRERRKSVFFGSVFGKEERRSHEADPMAREGDPA
jgi:hypothetical protein